MQTTFEPLLWLFSAERWLELSRFSIGGAVTNEEAGDGPSRGFFWSKRAKNPFQINTVAWKELSRFPEGVSLRYYTCSEQQLMKQLHGCKTVVCLPSMNSNPKLPLYNGHYSFKHFQSCHYIQRRSNLTEPFYFLSPMANIHPFPNHCHLVSEITVNALKVKV